MSNITRVFIDGNNKSVSPAINKDSSSTRNSSYTSHHVEKKYANTQGFSPSRTNSAVKSVSHSSPETYYYGSADTSPREGFITQVPINSFMGLHISPSSKTTDSYQSHSQSFVNTLPTSTAVHTDYNYGNNYNNYANDSVSKHSHEQNSLPAYRNINVNATNNSLSNPLCIRCSRTVYPAERIEPAKHRVFHTGCFRCVECGVKLTIKTYYQNLRDKTDNEVYCKSHQPQLGAAKMDATAKSIMSFSNIPKLNTVNEQIRGGIGSSQRSIKIDASAFDSYSPQQEIERMESNYSNERNYSDYSNAGTWGSRQRTEGPANVARSIPIERETIQQEDKYQRYDSPIRYDSPGRQNYDSPTKFVSTPDSHYESSTTNNYAPKVNYRSDFSPEPNYGSPPKSGYGSPHQPQYGSPSHRSYYGFTSSPSYESPPKARYESPPRASYDSHSSKRDLDSPPKANYVTPPKANYVNPPNTSYNNSSKSIYASSTKSGYASPPQSGYASPPQSGYASPPQSGYATPPHSKYGSPPRSSHGYPSKANYNQQHHQSKHEYSHKYVHDQPQSGGGIKPWMNHI